MSKKPDKSRHDLTIIVLETKAELTTEYEGICTCGLPVGVGWSTTRRKDCVVTCECGRRWEFIFGLHNAKLVDQINLK